MLKRDVALKEEKASLFDLFWSVLRFSSVEYQKGTVCVCVIGGLGAVENGIGRNKWTM